MWRLSLNHSAKHTFFKIPNGNVQKGRTLKTRPNSLNEKKQMALFDLVNSSESRLFHLLLRHKAPLISEFKMVCNKLHHLLPVNSKFIATLISKLENRVS